MSSTNSNQRSPAAGWNGVLGVCVSELRTSEQPIFLTTREVADLLRGKERKVYELAAAGEIPHRRVTGKLLFPKDEIVAWIDGEPAGASERPAVLAGSHDPLLEWTLRESGSGLAALLDGSIDGLDRFMRGEASVAAMHVPEAVGFNVETVMARHPRGVVLLAFAVRTQGLIFSRKALGSEPALADLSGRRVVLRQPGSGARALFDRLCRDAAVGQAYVAHPTLARTETDAAATVYSGEADVALGLQAVAQQFRLDFMPLVEEQFDLLIDRRAYFTPPLQALFAFCRSPAFAAKAASLGGYDVGRLGSVRWLST